MLKATTPERRLDEIDDHHSKLEPFAYFGATTACLALYVPMHGDLPGLGTWLVFMVFMVGMTFVSAFLAITLWLPLIVWLGRMDVHEAIVALTRPNANPRLVQRFLQEWWDNQMALDAFLIVFRIALTVAVYRLFGPLLGIL